MTAELNFASGLLLLEYDLENDPRARAIGIVVGAGHGVEPLDEDERARPVASASPLWISRHRAEIAVGLSGALIASGLLLGGLGSEAPSAVAYLLAIFSGGRIIWRRAATSLMARTIDSNVLMTVAVAGAAAIGKWGEGATVIFLFVLGGWLEARLLARTRASVCELSDIAPTRARVRREGDETDVPPTDVGIGEQVVVRPGERVPLDGEIIDGRSALDESPISGESVPVDRSVGDRVFAGALNMSGTVLIRTTAASSDTALARIARFLEVAHASRAPVGRSVDRLSRMYTSVVLAGAMLIAVGAPIAGELTGLWPGVEAWRDWVYRSLVLLVVSCPCTFVVSTPVAVVSAITRAARDGILVKDGAFFELAGKVRAIVFDKTGTLTSGGQMLSVSGLIGLADESRAESGSVAKSLRALGVQHLVMFTGDDPLAAARVAAEVGVDAYRACLPPDETSGAVAELREQFGVVAMVGDAVNGAPALATADIGIAKGAAGSLAAIEAADVALMRDDLSALAGFFDLGKRTMAVIRQNVLLSLGVKVVVLALVISGAATVWMAVLADAGAALLITWNGLRLLRSRGQ